MQASPQKTGKFGFITTEPGVTKLHMSVLLYAAFVSIALATFDAFGTPYVLSASIGVPLNEQKHLRKSFKPLTIMATINNFILC